MKLSSYVMAPLLLLGITAHSASAGPLLWSLSPLTLQGCCIPPLNEQHGVLSGTFLFDWQTQTFSNWSFDISGYTSPVEHLNAVLTPATSSVMVQNGSFLHLTYAGDIGDLVLTFGYLTTFGVVEVPLTSFGGNVPVIASNSSRLVSFFASSFGGNVASLSNVPEPAAGALVLIAGAVLCLWKPGRFRRTASKP